MVFAETFKALSHPIRREILTLLKEKSLTAGEIASEKHNRNSKCLVEFSFTCRCKVELDGKCST